MQYLEKFEFEMKGLHKVLDAREKAYAQLRDTGVVSPVVGTASMGETEGLSEAKEGDVPAGAPTQEQRERRRKKEERPGLLGLFGL